MTEDVQAITVRLPVPLYEWLRRAAFERRVPMSRIVITVLEQVRADETKTS